MADNLKIGDRIQWLNMFTRGEYKNGTVIGAEVDGAIAAFMDDCTEAAVTVKELLKLPVLNHMRVWTEGYSPFTMGGSCHHPVGAWVQVGEKHELGCGYFGYLLTHPDHGDTYVAESMTGAFIGPSLDRVKLDIAAAKAAVMKTQIEDARKRMELMREEEPDRFWSRIRKRKGDA